MEEHDHSAPAMRTLKFAAEVVGDVQGLADYLGVDEAQLTEWITGKVRPPNEVFIKALDIVAAGPLRRDQADKMQMHADRLQAHADRMQASANRAQASADRIQSAADRAQQIADRTRQTGVTESDLAAVERIVERAKKDSTSTS